MQKTKRKSLLRKYLCMTLLTILISFAILGLVMLLFFSSNWKHDKRDTLAKNALSVSDMVAHSVTVDANGRMVLEQDTTGRI